MKDNQLLFLISQPRSGSSMLQQMIANHPDVNSVPEPWMMLPLIYSYKKDKTATSIYSNWIANENLHAFLSLTEGHDLYKNNIKETALALYGKVIGDATYFLDKTPRYYHILPDLIELFPNAKFILLVRNPLSVFASFLNIYFKGKLRGLPRTDLHSDLFNAPKIILDTKKKNLPNVFFTRYEDLVNDSKKEMGNIFDFLELKSIADAGEYHVNEQFQKTGFIDPKSVKKHNKPVADYKQAWKQNITTGLKKKWLVDYIDFLGNPLFEEFGYDFNETMETIKAHSVKPSLISLSKKYTTNSYGSYSKLDQLKIKTLLGISDFFNKKK